MSIILYNGSMIFQLLLTQAMAKLRKKTKLFAYNINTSLKNKLL